MRKVRFLDFDGVLNTKYWDRNATIDRYGYAFDPNAVANLKRILDETDADIVISSSWKSMGLTNLRKMWYDRKLPGQIIDITPDYLSEELLLNSDLNNDDILYNRGCEIKAWLSKHGDEVSNYVIIDDMDDILPEQQSHFIQIDPEVGITMFDAKCIIRFLNSQV